MTAGDYTVEFEINAENYRDWHDNVYEKPGGEMSQGYSPALSLKRHIVDQIEKVVAADYLQRTRQGNNQL